MQPAKKHQPQSVAPTICEFRHCSLTLLAPASADRKFFLRVRVLELTGIPDVDGGFHPSETCYEAGSDVSVSTTPVSRISRGSAQLFVGPASSSRSEQMKVRDSTRATSEGSERTR